MTKRSTKRQRGVEVRAHCPAPTPEFPPNVLKDLEARCEWWLPIRVEARGEQLPYDVDMLVDLEDRTDRAQLVVVELTLRRRPGDPPITSSVFRKALPVQRLLREAVAKATVFWEYRFDDEADWDRRDETQEREARGLVYVPGPSATPGRKHEIPDKDLPRVLRTYESAGGKGRGGTAAVAAVWGVHRTTAWNAVKRAQERKGSR
jgi:hypothetical protein